jgi:integrase
MTAKISEQFVKIVAVPATGSTTVWDTDITGFGLRVHAKGTRSFFFDYRHNKKGKRIAIGKWPAWSALAARNRAKELRQEVDSGRDPADEKRERRDAPTMRDLAERFKRERLESTGRSRPKDEGRMVDEIVRILGKDTKVASIHYGDMQDLHRKITNGHEGKKPRPVRANRILACASVMFSMSLKPVAGEDKSWRSSVDGNPCKGIERNHEEPSGQLYSPAQLNAITDALNSYPGRTSADCLRLIMLTGCRPCESKRATWSQFDKKPGYWVKPASTTKQKKEHDVPLSAPARQLIDRLRTESRSTAGDAHVFPGKIAGTHVDMGVNHCWYHVRRQAGLDKSCRVYDLRHSFASLAASGGASLFIVGKLLGHSIARTTERYARHLKSDVLQAVTDMVAGEITGKPRLVSSNQP